MGEHINDALRSWIGLCFRALGACLILHFRWRSFRFRQHQTSLRRRLNISKDTPLQTAAALEALPRDPSARLASTSGSLSTPKQLPYSARRLRLARWIFFAALCRIFGPLGLRRASLFVLAPWTEDSSLTTLLLEEKRTPPWWICVQAPYRIHRHPEVKRLIARYGETVVKWWLLIVANPGLLYATNPSTLSLMLEELPSIWPALRTLASEPASVHRVVASRGSAERLAKVTASETPLPIETLLPSLEAFISWDGGYVRPFVDKVQAALPSRCRFVPMYSMSTETVETVPTVRSGNIAFVPMAPGVLYEFLPLDGDTLLAPWDLVPGESYVMVVSDIYGLRRYQTEDVFLCHAMDGGIPDLRFQRRRHLSYSFAGEKLTGEQCQQAIRELQEEAFLTCFPSLEGGAHYKLIRVGDGPATTQELGLRFDEALRRMNSEYDAKRQSRRLGPPSFQTASLETFLKQAGAAGPTAQFKFLPLYPRLWQDDIDA